MRRLLFNRRVGLVVAIVGGLLAVALWPSAVAVDAGSATRGPLVVTIDEEGETRVRDRYVVDSPVTARLRRIVLREGDDVQVGTIVAQLDPAPLDARALEEGKARLEAALDGERVARAGFAIGPSALKIVRTPSSRRAWAACLSAG